MSLNEELTLQRKFKHHFLKLPIGFWRHVGTTSRADLRKCGVTIGCAACSDTTVHGKTAKPTTEECQTRIGEQMEHDPEA